MEKLFIAFTFFFTMTAILPFDKGDTEKQSNHPPAGADVQIDGPYVHYTQHHVLENYIIETNGSRQVKTATHNLQDKDKIVLNVMTDVAGEYFQVRLKKKLRNEKSEFRQVKKLLCLSDIEGNFGALRKLLQANKVIDESLRWTFGEGHLVLAGDLFDRGQQVTEVLWFIYDLEEKAKEEGGYVHFVLGNHEIMNLIGDRRFIHPKYTETARLLSFDYVSLYDESSELGKWLRTKNIVEKIGDMLFVHGGISSAVNYLDLSVSDINLVARPYYSDDDIPTASRDEALLFGDQGPLWYRGYYDKENTSILLSLDSTLTKFGVNHIITGHTIVGDTVSVWYNGKLLNTDVAHAEGNSEALLVQDGNYYRVDAEGKKVLLLQAGKK